MRTTPCLLSDDICLFETPMELTHKVGTRQILFRASGLFWWGHFSLFCAQEVRASEAEAKTDIYFTAIILESCHEEKLSAKNVHNLQPWKSFSFSFVQLSGFNITNSKGKRFPLTHDKMQNSLFALFVPSWIFSFRKKEMGELDNMKFIVEGLGLVSIFLKITTNLFLFRCLLAFLE